MKILFIGCICEEKFFYNLVWNSKTIKPSIAGQRFERMIVEGISSESEIELLSYIPVSTYPHYPHIICFRKAELIYKGIPVRYIPFLNLPCLKQITILLYTFWFVLRWLIANHRIKEKIIFLNVIYPPTALPSLLLGRLLGCRVVTLVPDISSFRFDYSPTTGIFKKYLMLFFKRISEWLDRRFDGYVLLTDYMKNIVNPRNKPYVVVEGMVEDHLRGLKNDISQKHVPPAIMYAGSLRARYGISKLIKAFSQMPIRECELWIFGSGDYVDTIRRVAEEDKRIKYFGTVTHAEVIEYETRATLLVNPRPSDEEFTKYSFPSKTLEYMASGTPLLTTPLPGIPSEYKEYIYTFEDESVEGMSKRMTDILSIPLEELHKFGQRARWFVMENKNHLVQSKKILYFLEQLLSNTNK
ncbi:glycosyltransferase family 4 protein [Thermosediminibacter litoriperuensis]|uniref:Glycosyltransferase involved in cell wall biosynthesis n=1 Tax=Thermosediminibacter litoriperuensis TaxID=291989 RepID=A0A5S5AN07_9FIRM|nr:glycosyltransferase family 4 protein [Thermosediminibacter litoriperuensis]TYP52411.1 glycosyltransferase involved in cell wall biosynthesis [Thermosediminibacter litoriperuensis]